MPDFKNNFDELSYKGAIEINLSEAIGMISLKGDLADKSFTKSAMLERQRLCPS